MKLNQLAMLCLTGLALSSCSQEEPAACGGCSKEEKSGYSSFESADTADEFSEWMSKADQQVAYENREEGSYFAFVEGRNHGGFHQYRHVLKEFDGEKYAEFAVFWGLSADNFYKLDLAMLKKGFERKNLQVFEDGEGKAFHQVVWLLPKE